MGWGLAPLPQQHAAPRWTSLGGAPTVKCPAGRDTVLAQLWRCPGAGFGSLDVLEMPGSRRSGVAGDSDCTALGPPSPASPLLGGGGLWKLPLPGAGGARAPCLGQHRGRFACLSICTALYSFLTLEFLYDCLE